MKLPEKISEVSMYRDFDGSNPYPPTSFMPFWDFELGNGDLFGLYWPVGKEMEAPLVVEMWHDSWEMSPQFSSLDSFLAATNELDDEDERPEPTLESDGKSPLVLFERAIELLSNGEIDYCISRLQLAIEILPEYTAALSLLALQYRRQKKTDLALEYALRALRCPPSFGRVNNQLGQWLGQQSDAPTSISDDPLWRHRQEISWNFGGQKQNDTYLVIQQVMEEYISLGMVTEWFHLNQTYSELMYRETTSFQERYSFHPREWRTDQLKLYAQLTGLSRDISEINAG